MLQVATAKKAAAAVIAGGESLCILQFSNKITSLCKVARAPKLELHTRLEAIASRALQCKPILVTFCSLFVSQTARAKKLELQTRLEALQKDLAQLSHLKPGQLRAENAEIQQLNEVRPLIS